MALHYNLSKILNHETICYTGTGDKRQISGTTECLIFATIFCGMGKIDAKNYGEFFFRIRFYESLHGALRNKWHDDGAPPTPIYISRVEVREHIGLSTNVSMETRAAWVKRIVSRWERDLRQAEDRKELDDENDLIAAAESAFERDNDLPTEPRAEND